MVLTVDLLLNALQTPVSWFGFPLLHFYCPVQVTCSSVQHPIKPFVDCCHHKFASLLQSLLIMLSQRRLLQSVSAPQRCGQVSPIFPSCRAFSSASGGSGGDSSEAADLDAAREWFQRFNKSTIPSKIAKTTFVRSSGPGGQKTNK